MLKLYQFPKSGNARIVRIALAEKGLEFERELVDVMKGEQNRPAFRRLNPHGKVPVLVDGEAVIYESSVINEYLEERFPAPPLLPPDALGRARARMLVHYFETVFAPNAGVFILESLLKTPEQHDAAKMRNCRAQLAVHCGFLEDSIGEQEYLSGAFSLADASFTPALSAMARCQFELAPRFPRLVAWLARVQGRPSFAASAD